MTTSKFRKELLLPAEEVKIYTDHLHQIQRRRQAGVRKAAETRRQRRKLLLYTNGGRIAVLKDSVLNYSSVLTNGVRSQELSSAIKEKWQD